MGEIRFSAFVAPEQRPPESLAVAICNGVRQPATSFKALTCGGARHDVRAFGFCQDEKGGADSRGAATASYRIGRRNLLQSDFRKERSRMKVYLIDNQGSEFADQIEVASGTTIEEFAQQRLRGGDPTDHLIRVNQLPATAEQILQNGDRVSIIPTRIASAQ